MLKNSRVMTWTAIGVTAGLFFVSGAGRQTWGIGAATQPTEASAPNVPVSTSEGPSLILGAPAPGWSVTGLDGKPVLVETLRGKPLVMQFGSLTEPVFRMHAASMEKLAAKYGDKATFLVVYQHESHAADGQTAIEPNTNDGYQLPAPTSQGERVEMAKQAVDRLKLSHQTMLVDSWNNATSKRYGDYPNMTFIIDAKGNLQAGYPWSDVKKIQTAVDALLSGRDVPDSVRGRIGTGSGVTSADVNDMYMQTVGGGSKLSVMLDGLALTDDQKMAIYPPLTQFLADVKNFRETRNGNAAEALKAAQAAAAAKKAGTTQPSTPDGAEAVSPEQLQQEIQKMRDSAAKLKAAVNATLPADKAKEFMDAIDQGPAKRLFQ